MKWTRMTKPDMLTWNAEISRATTLDNKLQATKECWELEKIVFPTEVSFKSAFKRNLNFFLAHGSIILTYGKVIKNYLIDTG